MSSYHDLPTFGDELVDLIHHWRNRGTSYDDMEAYLEDALANVRAQERDE